MTTNTNTPSTWDNPNEGVQVPTWHPLGSATPSSREPLNSAYRRILATDTTQLWLAAGGEYTILGDDWETDPSDQPAITLDDPTAPERITLAVEAANFFCKETWAALADATMQMVDSECKAIKELLSYSAGTNPALRQTLTQSTTHRILLTLNSLARYPHGKLPSNSIERRYLLFIEQHLPTYTTQYLNHNHDIWAHPFKAYAQVINTEAATTALATFHTQWNELNNTKKG